MKCTLLITTQNRTDLLRNSLRFFDLNPKARVPDQIIVVDDGGTDDCRILCATTRLPIDYIYNNNPGETNCCLARNIGLRHAKHEHIITSEPEVVFMTNVIGQLLFAHKRHPDWILQSDVCYHGIDPEFALPPRLVPGWPYVNLWSRRVLNEIGGWDEALPEAWGWDDIDLLERLKWIGFDHRPVPGVTVHHQWHPSRICPAVENEAYVRNKNLSTDLVANRNIDWGTVLR